MQEQVCRPVDADLRRNSAESVSIFRLKCINCYKIGKNSDLDGLGRGRNRPFAGISITDSSITVL